MPPTGLTKRLEVLTNFERAIHRRRTGAQPTRQPMACPKVNFGDETGQRQGTPPGKLVAPRPPWRHMLWRTNGQQRQIGDSSPVRSATVPKVNGDRSNALECVNEAFGKINKSRTDQVRDGARAPDILLHFKKLTTTSRMQENAVRAIQHVVAIWHPVAICWGEQKRNQCESLIRRRFVPPLFQWLSRGLANASILRLSRLRRCVR